MPPDDEHDDVPPTRLTPARLPSRNGTASAEHQLPPTSAGPHATGQGRQLPEASLPTQPALSKSKQATVEPLGFIRTLLADLDSCTAPAPASRLELAARNGEASGRLSRETTRHAAVSVALPVADQDGIPFSVVTLRAILAEILAVHGGATLRPAFGVCRARDRLEIDALIDIEIWTARVGPLIEQVTRWRKLLNQREIVVRVLNRIDFHSVVEALQEDDTSTSHAGESSR